MQKTIKHWNEDDRPREKLATKGAAALSDAELLAILIGSGTANFSALDAAKGVLALAQNKVHDLGRLSVKELQQVKGIGEARAISIAAALELGRRRQAAQPDDKRSLNTSDLLAETFRPMMQDLNHEVVAVLYLNHKLHVLRHEIISQGGMTSTVVDVRMILKHALLYNATRVALGHNHPSGSTQPSSEDKDLTDKLVHAARLMDIKVIDHIIIGGQAHFSFNDNGLL